MKVFLKSISLLLVQLLAWQGLQAQVFQKRKYTRGYLLNVNSSGKSSSNTQKKLRFILKQERGASISNKNIQTNYYLDTVSKTQLIQAVELTQKEETNSKSTKAICRTVSSVITKAQESKVNRKLINLAIEKKQYVKSENSFSQSNKIRKNAIQCTIKQSDFWEDLWEGILEVLLTLALLVVIGGIAWITKLPPEAVISILTLITIIVVLCYIDFTLEDVFSGCLGHS